LFEIRGEKLGNSAVFCSTAVSSRQVICDSSMAYRVKRIALGAAICFPRQGKMAGGGEKRVQVQTAPEDVPFFR
jgi:hypothetical protein